MVWAGICAAGKTPLVFIDRNVKINTDVYQQVILRGSLQPWAQSLGVATGLGSSTFREVDNGIVQRVVSRNVGEGCVANEFS